MEGEIDMSYHTMAVRLKKPVFFFILLFATVFVSAQKIENVGYKTEGKTIRVTYDLAGVKPGQTFFVSLYVSQDDGVTWKGPLTAVTGHAGANQTGGAGKTVVWDVLAEMPKLTGSIVFEVRAKISGGLGGEFEMVFVQGGSFQMGSNESDDEKPVHTVTVGDFYMGKYEVTQKQWRQIMGNDPPELYFKGCDQCPVEGVSWKDVQEFVQKLNQKTGKNYRLPTEAEWEYAAKGGNQSHGYTYSGSNTVGDVAWYEGNSGSKTHPVGQKQSNELGIYDMSGNVWEWCSDWYGSDYYKNSPATNPKGPASGSNRVFRGGGWYDFAQGCRAAYRSNYAPDGRYDLGFRLVFVP